jgi:membrane-associated phospholipid phosphatase
MLVVLRLAVGKGSTPLDDWFDKLDHNAAWTLAALARPPLLAVVALTVVGWALYRRCWRLAALATVSPPAAYLLVQFIKPMFGRYIGDGLAYPSGHTTVTTVVLGFFVLVAGGALWAVLVASTYVALAMVGVGSTFHFFTDTVGGLLLGTAIVCIAALVAHRDLTRVNPDAIYVTGGR